MTTGPSDDEFLPGGHPPFDEADEADVLEQELKVPNDDELLPGEHPPFDEADEADVLEQELEVPDDDEDYERG
jgi:hypothetical protein